MSNYLKLVKSVIIDSKNRLISHDSSLKLTGKGRSAFVFRINASDKAVKVYFPEYIDLAKEEAEIYKSLQHIHYFPFVYEAGWNYIVMDYIEGYTLFDCMAHGTRITSAHIKEIDRALSLASASGLNPSDIHLRNIFITSSGEIKLIDVARYRQEKDCKQWDHLKKAYRQFYQRRFFIKKLPEPFLNVVAFLYKKGCIPCYRR